MSPETLFDGPSALIVVGGTVLTTVLRCGLGDSATALRALRGLARRRFDAGLLKAELAVHVQEMQQDGVIRTEPHHSGDPEFDEATGALIGTRSAASLHAAHIAHKRRRAEQNMRAVRTLGQAADLSPVLGLAGTLVSLSQLPSGGGEGGSFTAAISMAVLTTLYGLLLGNMVFAPLARMVARRAGDEEKARQEVLDWLEQQVAVALPRHGDLLPSAPPSVAKRR
ncbi:MotA/TolQ/ExbB proton channel family protein [Novosphingobium profundi]|uniref:MotA/TolQ/ExbB proton channel family protein n=1 Tax=Novosphingobium profundi TaxID=1774954 RepID=UPI001BDACFF4|nr:MotA/TolQ/ExbB proton channel family protein [Novosphingobium profundi]MBT0670406.1 MotA/TolQ/ExbB proton channel family protein [Novosphingobium profundi]